MNPSEKPDKEFIYVDVSSISSESLTIVDFKRLLGRDAPSRARKAINSRDVIFATVRPALMRVAMVPDRLDGQVCSTGFCVLRPDVSQLDPEYLFFCLLTKRVAQAVDALQKGATYPAISDSDLLMQPIPLPPLPEQRAIARALRTVQQAQQARRREVALERERKAALTEQFFSSGISGGETKQSDIGEIPDSWQVYELRDLAQVAYGLTVNETRRKSRQLVPYLTVANVER